MRAKTNAMVSIVLTTRVPIQQGGINVSMIRAAQLMYATLTTLALPKIVCQTERVVPEAMLANQTFAMESA